MDPLVVSIAENGLLMLIAWRWGVGTSRVYDEWPALLGAVAQARQLGFARVIAWGAFVICVLRHMGWPLLAAVCAIIVIAGGGA